MRLKTIAAVFIAGFILCALVASLGSCTRLTHNQTTATFNQAIGDVDGDNIGAFLGTIPNDSVVEGYLTIMHTGDNMAMTEKRENLSEEVLLYTGPCEAIEGNGAQDRVHDHSSFKTGYIKCPRLFNRNVLGWVGVQFNVAGHQREVPLPCLLADFNDFGVHKFIKKIVTCDPNETGHPILIELVEASPYDQPNRKAPHAPPVHTVGNNTDD